MVLSVVIPFFNELHLINRAVESVFIQTPVKTELSIEILIGNDGNIPNEKILQSVARNLRAQVKIIKNDGPKGPGGARNSGLEQAQGDLIAFLDADDHWIAGKLEKQLRLIEKGFSFIATAYRFENSGVIIYPPPNISTEMDIFHKLGIGTSTVLVHRRLCEGFFFSHIRFCQDIDYWYSLAHSDQFKYASINDSLVVYSQSGTTRNKFEQLFYFHSMLAKNEISNLQKIPILLNYSLRGLYNHFLRPRN